MFCDEKLFKIFLYLWIYFVQKIAELVPEKYPLLGKGWSFGVVRPIAESQSFCGLVFNTLSHFSDLIFSWSAS